MWGSFARWGVAIAVAVCAAGCGGGHSHAVVRVTPASGLIDEAARVTITGLSPNGTATLSAAWRSFDGVTWKSSQTVRADGDGRVTLSGVDGTRFIWSMKRPNPGRSFFGANARHPTPVNLTVVEAGRVVARATVRRAVTTSSVRARTLTVAKDGLAGSYYAPKGGQRRPALMVLGGSGGGIPVDLAAMLASRGYPALALGYYGQAGLPPELSHIPLEYFARGLHWLARQPGVDRRRLIVAGASRGGEASLLVAATFPQLVHGAIGLAPGYEVGASLGPDGGAAWTFRGKDLPFGRVIAVERISGRVLVASGGDDAVWSSSVNTDQIELRLRDHHFRFPHERLDFAHAGHDLSVPFMPQADPATFGGDRRATAAAQMVVWEHVLRLLAKDS